MDFRGGKPPDFSFQEKKGNVILSYFAVFGRFSDLKDIGEIGL